MALNNSRWLILFALLAAIILGGLSYSTQREKVLKNDLKEAEIKIDSLEIVKNDYLQRIIGDSIRLRKKDSIIALLKIREIELLDSIKKNRYDYKETRRVYLSRDLNDRVREFSKLANRND